MESDLDELLPLVWLHVTFGLAALGRYDLSVIDSYRDSCNLRQLVVQHSQERTPLRSIVVGTHYNVSLAEMKYYLGTLSSIRTALQRTAINSGVDVLQPFANGAMPSTVLLATHCD